MSMLRLAVPADFVLARDVCSYGYFLLEPNHWDPGTRTFRTTIDLGGAAVTFRIRQGSEYRGRGGGGLVPAPSAYAKEYRALRSAAGQPLAVRPDAPLS